MDWAVIAQLGSAAGAVAVTWLISKNIVAPFLTLHKEESSENRKLLENHLSLQTRVLQNLVDVTTEHRARTEK